jgi:hypothetical protein
MVKETLVARLPRQGLLEVAENRLPHRPFRLFRLDGPGSPPGTPRDYWLRRTVMVCRSHGANNAVGALHKFRRYSRRVGNFFLVLSFLGGRNRICCFFSALFPLLVGLGAGPAVGAGAGRPRALGVCVGGSDGDPPAASAFFFDFFFPLAFLENEPVKK